MVMQNLALLAQNDDAAAAAAAGIGLVGMLVALVILLVVIAGAWKIFVKAGKPGWASLIPIYNYIVFLDIIGKPVWWIILILIPCITPFILIVMHIELAKVFGKGTGYGLGLAFIPVIFYPLLGFSDAKYQRPAAPVTA